MATHRFGITSRRERWRGIRSIPETVDGYDWAPFDLIYRAYYWRGHLIWKTELAARELDQYALVFKWAFPS